MKFTGRQDIEAPVGFVFDALRDFDGWERAAMRRGADVTRTATGDASGAGLAWTIRFPFRGKDRKLEVQLAGLQIPAQMTFAGQGGSFEGSAVIDLLELGAKRTRLAIVSEIKPRGLAARLMLQTLKLAKGRTQARFNARVAALAGEIEENYRAVTRRLGR